MKQFIITTYFCVLCYTIVTALDPIGPIRAFVETNLIGLPVIREPQTWEFDPDVALRRRWQFIDLHGDKGDRLIERLGLGIDGFDEERLKQQRRRDEGHLGEYKILKGVSPVGTMIFCVYTKSTPGTLSYMHMFIPKKSLEAFAFGTRKEKLAINNQIL